MTMTNRYTFNINPWYVNIIGLTEGVNLLEYIDYNKTYINSISQIYAETIITLQPPHNNITFTYFTPLSQINIYKNNQYISTLQNLPKDQYEYIIAPIKH